MLEARKINDKVVGVATDYPLQIDLRYSGKKYYGTEEPVVWFKGNKMYIDRRVMEEYGLTLEIVDERNGRELPRCDYAQFPLKTRVKSA